MLAEPGAFCRVSLTSQLRPRLARCIRGPACNLIQLETGVLDQLLQLGLGEAFVLLNMHDDPASSDVDIQAGDAILFFELLFNAIRTVGTGQAGHLEDIGVVRLVRGRGVRGLRGKAGQAQEQRGQ